MTWHAHRIQLTLRSPLHCGQLPMGFVARTHAFVPCHLPFFAMVPATVALLGMPDRRASYMAVQGLFEHCLRTTPLYIYEDAPLFPWDDTRWQRAEQAYLSSHYGVTLDWKKRSAEEGKLFETEVILQHAKGRHTPTVLDGAVFFRAHEHEDVTFLAEGAVQKGDVTVSLVDILSHMRLGGNGTRALARPACASLSAYEGDLWGQYALCLDADMPRIIVKPGECGPLPLRHFETRHIRGKAAVLTGRLYDAKRGAGLAMDTATMAWREGWKSAEERMVSLQYPRFGVAV